MGQRDKPASPFAALEALRDQLPAGPEPAPKIESAPPVLDRRFAGKLVVARTKKGRGGKTVTTVEGIAAEGQALETIAKGLRKSLGCGVSIEDGRLVAQGDQTERVRAWLASQGAKRVVIGS